MSGAKGDMVVAACRPALRPNKKFSNCLTGPETLDIKPLQGFLSLDQHNKGDKL
jgi:hypothetical protein